MRYPHGLFSASDAVLQPTFFFSAGCIAGNSVTSTDNAATLRVSLPEREGVQHRKF